MKSPRRNFFSVTVLLTALLSGAPGSAAVLADEQSNGLSFDLSFSKELSEQALDGRMFLIISDNGETEPRFQISVIVGFAPECQQIFGVDVEGLAPGEKVRFDTSVFGFPLKSLSEIPPGEYWIQGLLDRYETFRRADGHVVKLPMDRGEGRHWNLAPGNLYSTPRKVMIDTAKEDTLEIVLDKEIPPFPAYRDTEYVKHISIESKLLTEFWGRPMRLGAFVLLPPGFEEHPEARYPLVICHGHFRRFFRAPVVFRETPPDPNATGDEKINQEYSYRFYQDWTGGRLPKVLLVTIQHANPYFDDSYAVNSANIGPYGEAITYELIPEIERRFRGIGAGWARAMYGGSTGGWEALAAQVFYPDEYNGCWAMCPDQIDFRAYTVVNIYEDNNAYYRESGRRRTPRPGARDGRGHVMATLEEMNHFELVIGTKARSGRQWDAWHAVFGPVGEDGYPKQLWDKMTGEIDHSVAAYYRENYDLRYVLERDWPKIGSKLVGKIHITVGDMDNFYLNNAVRLMEEFLESTTDPNYGGSVEYGDGYIHCWGGDPTMPLVENYLTVIQRYLPKMVDHFIETAPEGADVESWRY
jgi:hypothetical protein